MHVTNPCDSLEGRRRTASLVSMSGHDRRGSEKSGRDLLFAQMRAGDRRDIRTID